MTGWSNLSPLSWCGLSGAALLAVCTLAWGWGSGELWGNEGLRARVAAEMANPANQYSWRVPRLEGEPLLTKPPLHYWIVATLGRITGRVGPFEARLPSLLAGVGLLGLACWQARRFAGWDALLATLLVMPCSLAFLTQVPSAELDLPLAFWVFAALFCLGRQVDSWAANPEGWGLWWWGVAACGLAGFLSKWTAPVFVLPVVVVCLATGGRWRMALLPGPWLALLGAVSCAGLWLRAAASEVGWPQLQGAVVEREGLPHLSPWHHGRAYPFQEWLTYPWLVLAMGLPAMAWLCSACFLPRKTLCQALQSTWIRLLVLAVVLPLVFWTVVPGHKPRHALPVVPPLAALAALAAGACLARATGPGRRGLLVALWVGAMLWMGVKVVRVEWLNREAMAAHAPTRVADQVSQVMGESTTLWVAGLRDDGLLLALAQRGIAVLRLPGQVGRQAGWWLVHPEEQAPVSAERWLEVTDQQKRSIWLLRLSSNDSQSTGPAGR